ncbi:tagaturonate reductase [uncultured Alistipes sp.]|jgi:mannitol-1-phosphate/altronate dehydrogenases|uniref:tagaturonate reductase n=1 Tax=uncultured Alistipes sp. TaxID=538949 RepID=UPI0025DD238B|nr:tagaturonate reductase [uncultured Alistipes sp.]
MLKPLNKTTVEKVDRPVTILQFGEGNFLRAFVDWQIDIANEKGVMNAGVAICQPILDPEHNVLKMIDMLHAQDNMYHVYLEGVENKQPKKDIRLVKSVMDSFNPYVDYARYEHYFLSPELKIVISNTTEAGIRYEQGDDLTARPAKSFPAKMTALLFERFKHFAGDPSKGLIVICCELIEDNGSTLHEYVIKHAQYHKLGQDFIDWVEANCHFCDTLVDRIVPGFPRDTINEIKEEIGFDDNLVVKAELYHLWAIGGPGYKEVMKELPLDKAGLHVIFMPSIKQFRDKKVRILNGSHTGMVPIALQMGCETVMDAFDTPDIERFVNDMVAEEVIPMIEEDQAEVKEFAAGILERFYNPFIKHMLKTISLNSLAKWEARNYPTVKDNWFKAHRVAQHECFTFAALMTLYSPQSGFEPDDTKEFVEYIRKNWNAADIESTITKIVMRSGIFTVDFSEVPGFIPAVSGYVRDIEEQGMTAALKKFLA